MSAIVCCLNTPVVNVQIQTPTDQNKINREATLGAKRPDGVKTGSLRPLFVYIRLLVQEEASLQVSPHVSGRGESVNEQVWLLPG